MRALTATPCLLGRHQARAGAGCGGGGRGVVPTRCHNITAGSCQDRAVTSSCCDLTCARLRAMPDFVVESFVATALGETAVCTQSIARLSVQNTHALCEHVVSICIVSPIQTSGVLHSTRLINTKHHLPSVGFVCSVHFSFTAKALTL